MYIRIMLRLSFFNFSIEYTEDNLILTYIKVTLNSQ